MQVQLLQQIQAAPKHLLAAANSGDQPPLEITFSRGLQQAKLNKLTASIAAR